MARIVDAGKKASEQDIEGYKNEEASERSLNRHSGYGEFAEIERCYHRDEDHHVGAEHYLSEGDAGFALNPWSSYDRLARVVVIIAALRSLVPLTPLADLLSKRQGRKLPATLNALGHGLIKRLSALRKNFLGRKVQGVNPRLDERRRLADVLLLYLKSPVFVFARSLENT